MENKILQNTNRKNLLQLIWLRTIAVLGQAQVILFVNYFLKISLPLQQMFLVLLMLVVVNFFSFFRYKSQKQISDESLFIELLFDVAALTAQLYFSGGISNPFISLFLLQVIISAILLRQIYAWFVGVVTVICYIWLSFNYQELHSLHHHDGGDFFNLHLHGMLVSYVFAAALLIIFVTKIIKNLREKDRDFYLLKQQSNEEEKLVRIALLATAAAHELSTPLSTISVILADWKKIDVAHSKEEFLQDIEVAEEQLNRCKKILSNILFSSGKERLEQAKAMSVKEALEALLKNWSDLRKPNNLLYDFAGNYDKKIILDESLTQVLFNIFDNALDESKDWISVKVRADEGEVVVTIQDRGRGFSAEVLQKIGTPNITTKNGNGLGLFLAVNVLRRIGGSFQAENLENGALVTVKFPI